MLCLCSVYALFVRSNPDTLMFPSITTHYRCFRDVRDNQEWCIEAGVVICYRDTFTAIIWWMNTLLVLADLACTILGGYGPPSGNPRPCLGPEKKQVESETVRVRHDDIKPSSFSCISWLNGLVMRRRR